jgi:hypothetical protein
MRKLGILLTICVISLPVVFVLTFSLSPFWGWFEEKSGFESLGHSGPADWCFVAVNIAVVLVCVAAWRRFRSYIDPRN